MLVSERLFRRDHAGSPSSAVSTPAPSYPVSIERVWVSVTSRAKNKPGRAPLGQNVMTTEAHPSDVALFALAAGTLDETKRVEIATHVRGCASCRAFVRAMEHVGGIVLDGLPPTSLVGGSLAAVMARLDEWTNGVSSRRKNAPLITSSKANLVKLTHRQREVLTVLARRLSNNELPRLLHIAEATTNIDPEALLQAYATAQEVLSRSEVQPLD
jgi:hypothetical protein